MDNPVMDTLIRMDHLQATLTRPEPLRFPQSLLTQIQPLRDALDALEQECQTRQTQRRGTATTPATHHAPAPHATRGVDYSLPIGDRD